MQHYWWATSAFSPSGFIFTSFLRISKRFSVTVNLESALHLNDLVFCFVNRAFSAFFILIEFILINKLLGHAKFFGDTVPLFTVVTNS